MIQGQDVLSISLSWQLHIQIYLMDLDSVRNILARANLALPPDLIKQIVQFLNEEIGVTSENMNY